MKGTSLCFMWLDSSDLGKSYFLIFHVGNIFVLCVAWLISWKMETRNSHLDRKQFYPMSMLLTTLLLHSCHHGNRKQCSFDWICCLRKSYRRNAGLGLILIFDLWSQVVSQKASILDVIGYHCRGRITCVQVMEITACTCLSRHL